MRDPFVAAVQVAAKQGLRPHIGQRPVSKVEAIGTARVIFPRCQFNEAGCSVGLKRLRAYRKEWDAERGLWKDRPRHDDASHGADAFMTLACSGIARSSRAGPVTATGSRIA